ncbi:MAG: hypothetical protein IKY52_09430, partial [Clostridia bacterium]|nr:hypothetical protein [Clostridia bacterium]
MEYPSLLWENGISGTRDLFPVGDNGRVTPAAGPTAQSVLDDLLPAGAFGILSSTYFRFPCSGTEIPARQKLILRMAHDPDFSETIAYLAEKTESFEQLYNRLHAPELPRNQYVLLFPAVAREYLALARTFACFVPDDTESREFGFAGDVQNHFRTILAMPQTADLERALDAFRKSRGEHVKLSLQGGMVTAYSAAERYEDTLRQYFEEMGIADAWPASRVHRADSAVVDAYCAVYPDVPDKARRLTETFQPFLTETCRMADVLYYRYEIQFLREAAAYTVKMEKMGYPMCLPTVAKDRMICLRDLRDVSLAARELHGTDVVPNDVRMLASDGSHFCFVTGANGGGKTTYLRGLGAALLFFLAGCPVSARSGEIWSFRRICSHFPSPENFDDTGRFADEMRRADDIRAIADADTAALFNETFSGTDEHKSEDCSRRLADDMYASGTFGLYVTHIHSLTHGKIPTLAAVIDENDNNRRTWKIRRMDGTDSSFAGDILKKYRLTE